MTYKEIFKQSPNVSKTPIRPRGIVLHHTAGSYAGSVAWCLNASSQVSYHCIVNTNGDRSDLALTTQRAWHAGKSSFKGQSDCNSFMLGIAVSGDTYKRDLTPQEIDSVSSWCVEQMKTYGITIDWVTDHKAISPGRKTDLSPKAFEQIMEAIKAKL
jgi:N-acetyl-anhydromuramyl-L-alanine amidase AmpD